MKSKKLNLSNSEKYWKKTIKLIPSGVQTFSKMPLQHVDGVSPKYIHKSKKCFSWDIDNNKYIDYMCGLGPIILGYADKVINNSVKNEINLGNIPSLPSLLETKLALKLNKLIPCAEMVRFGKNGSDVTQAAIRAARGITGRDKVAICGYHGWHDWYIGTTTRDLGVPNTIKKLSLKFNYNDINSLNDLFKKNKRKIAAVIMEPTNFIRPKEKFLEKVKDLCEQNNTLLIFDEVITGFRMNIGGAQKVFKVTPDIACFGKAMANGFPLSAIVGKKKYMEIFDEVFFSFTFGGETSAIAASLSTIEEIKKRGTIKYINTYGNDLIKNFNKLAKKYKIENYLKATGYGWWPLLNFYDYEGKPSKLLESIFRQEIIRQGILTRSGIFITSSHSKKVFEKTMKIFDITLKTIKKGIINNNLKHLLDGKVIEPVIRSESLKRRKV